MKPINPAKSFDTRLVAALFFVAGALSACAHSTPVVSAPLGAPETSQLQAAIVGTCEVTATQKEGAEPKSDSSGLKFTFQPDGRGAYVAPAPIGSPVQANYTYHLEGRNILMDGPIKAFRADDFSGATLKLFLYDMSQTYFCTKRT